MAVKWRYEEHNDCEIARFKCNGFELYVIDCDGDASNWEVKYNGVIVAEEDYLYSTTPYHFDLAQERAEQALWAECKRQQREALAAMKGHANVV